MSERARPKTKRHRIDLLLVERELAPSRTAAQALILAGRVHSGGVRIDKAGTLIATDAELTVTLAERYVSRGGHKLEGALADLALSVAHYACVDIGASTGGFTDCLLQHGAARVYAIDVGHGQLAERLRRDPRVVNRERTNARTLTRADFPEKIDLIVVDASFIGIGKLLPAIASILSAEGRLLAMVKPQFEAGRDEARKRRGIIPDGELRSKILDGVVKAIAAAGFEVLGCADSRVRGPKGNLEHFVLARHP